MTYSFADIAERLMARFEGQLPLDVVVRVARESEASVQRAEPVAGEPSADAVERAAARRLTELVESGQNGPAETTDVPLPRTPS